MTGELLRGRHFGMSGVTLFLASVVRECQRCWRGGQRQLGTLLHGRAVKCVIRSFPMRLLSSPLGILSGTRRCAGPLAQSPLYGLSSDAQVVEVRTVWIRWCYASSLAPWRGGVRKETLTVLLLFSVTEFYVGALPRLRGSSSASRWVGRSRVCMLYSFARCLGLCFNL